METIKHVDFDKYAEFVDAVTSDASKDFLSLSDRLVALDEKGANIERLLTAAVGINAEGGEFMEIVKKMIFQGKPFNEDNREHMIIELGDIMWYVAQACMALEVSLDDEVAHIFLSILLLLHLLDFLLGYQHENSYGLNLSPYVAYNEHTHEQEFSIYP